MSPRDYITVPESWFQLVGMIAGFMLLGYSVFSYLFGSLTH